MVGSFLVVAEVPFFYSAGHLGGRLFRGQSRQPGWCGIYLEPRMVNFRARAARERISLWSILGSKLKAQSGALGAPILVGFDIRFWSTYFCFHFVSILFGVWIMKIGSPTWRYCQTNSGNPLLGRLRGTPYVGISSVFSLAGYPRFATLRWGYFLVFCSPKTLGISASNTRIHTHPLRHPQRRPTLYRKVGS